MHPLIYKIRNELRGYYSDAEALSIAKLVLVDVFGFSVIELYGGKDKSFSEKEQKLLDDIISRLHKNEPIQYVIGTEFFCGFTFEVDRNVLIPRPETQELVEWIVTDCQGISGCCVLDIGTGSGCIPISLARLLDKPLVESWDISEGALQVAKRNCERNGVKILLRKQDVFEANCTNGEYDVIVSNPPYITEKEKSDMDTNVLDWEPSLALFVPDSDPLLYYRKIAELGFSLLKDEGKLYFEINRAFGIATQSMLMKMGYKHVELRKDLSGNDRMIKAIK